MELTNRSSADAGADRGSIAPNLAATDELCLAFIVALGPNAEFTMRNENVAQDEHEKKNLPDYARRYCAVPQPLEFSFCFVVLVCEVVATCMAPRLTSIAKRPHHDRTNDSESV